MSVVVWQDPVAYVRSWSKTLTIVVPLPSESDYCRKAIAAHASLLYDCPLFANMAKRSVFRFVRKYLESYTEMLNEFGFVQTILYLKDIGDVFLRCFTKASDFGHNHVNFDMVEELTLSPIYLAINHLHVLSGDEFYNLVKWVLSWHYFLSKLPISRPDLEDSAESAWIQRQIETQNAALPSLNDLDWVRRVVAWLFQMDNNYYPIGHHGPGSTATGDRLVPDKNLSYKPTLQTTQLTTTHPSESDFLLSDPMSSRLMFVPKDIKSLRPITMEPVAMQYAQQPWKDHLYSQTDDPSSDLPISRFIRYRDQGLSRKLASRGSSCPHRDDMPATIDLSAASDRLSVDLIVNLFSGNLLHILMCGRSWGSDTSEGYVEHGMFGGMGSALTFPVQSIVFCAIAIVATVKELYLREMGVLPSNAGEVLPDYLDLFGFRPKYRSVAKSVRVYGDDITVPDFAVTRLVLMLTDFGLSVNVDKSFSGLSAVRESCGIFALGGRDITPLRFRLPTVNNRGRVDFAAYEGQRLLINRSFIYGYKTLYRFLVRDLKKSKLLMWPEDYNKSSMPGARFGYARQHLGKPSLLFESYRGDVDYVGFISLRDSIYTHKIDLWEPVKAFTSFTGKTDVVLDKESEYYYLSQAYRLMYQRDLHTESHGVIPRGIRLVKSNAILLDSSGGEKFSAWGWAPR